MGLVCCPCPLQGLRRSPICDIFAIIGGSVECVSSRPRSLGYEGVTGCITAHLSSCYGISRWCMQLGPGIGRNALRVNVVVCKIETRLCVSMVNCGKWKVKSPVNVEVAVVTRWSRGDLECAECTSLKNQLLGLDGKAGPRKWYLRRTGLPHGNLNMLCLKRAQCCENLPVLRR